MGRHPVMVRQVCPLVPFDLAQSPEVLATAEFVWREDAPLELSFSLCPRLRESSMDCVSFNGGTTSQTVQRLDNLWTHTCFEAFLARPSSKGYWEMNVSASGDWNLYRFSDYRTGRVEEVQATTPKVSLRRNRVGCRCTIQIPLQPWWPHSEIPEIALTMVLEDQQGNLSYWSLSHPGDKPDFHDRRGFLHW